MSRDWNWYKAKPKHAPPKRGIKIKKSGTTWWGKRWIEALERMSSGYANRLARGRTYARAGRTHDLIAQAGEITAKVTGSRARPYEVRIALAPLRTVVWKKAIAAMAAKAQFTAELLAGQMPREIDSAFKEAGASLFPAKTTELTTSCSCPDWANPCKHVAATHYVLGEALDRDPFLLFELRGRTKEQVLEALREARAAGTEDAATTSGRAKAKQRAGARAKRAGQAKGSAQPTPEDEIPSVSLGRLRKADYDTPREPLPSLHLAFETPSVSGAVLRQLGVPRAWSSELSPAEMLSPVVRAAAEEARRIAMVEPESVEEPAQNESAKRATPAARARRKEAKATANAGGVKRARRPPRP